MVRPYNNPDEKATHTFKTCSRCAQTKLLNEFGFSNKQILKYRSECRICRNVILKDEYAKRKAKIPVNILISA